MQNNEKPQNNKPYYGDINRRGWMDDNYPVCKNCKHWDCDNAHDLDPLGEWKTCAIHLKDTNESDECKHFQCLVRRSLN